MRRWLTAHDDFPAPRGLRVRADFGRRDHQTFALHISIYGPIDALTWRNLDAAGRHDKLWRHGCMEAFVAAVGTTDYVELNFAPEQRWAAYVFDAYRDGMRSADVAIHAQHWFVRDLSVRRLEMQVLLDLPELYGAADWIVGVTTILEAADGTKSYWALAHAPGPPDFHNPATFTATLPPPPR